MEDSKSTDPDPIIRKKKRSGSNKNTLVQTRKSVFRLFICDFIDWILSFFSSSGFEQVLSGETGQSSSVLADIQRISQ